MNHHRLSLRFVKECWMQPLFALRYAALLALQQRPLNVEIAFLQLNQSHLNDLLRKIG